MPKYDYTVETRPNGRKFTRARVAGRQRMFSGVTEKAVHLAIAQARADEARGTYIDPTDAKVTVREYGEQWRASHPGAFGTTETIRNSLVYHWYPIIGDVPLSKLRPSHIQAGVKELSTRLAPLTLRETTFSHLRQMLRAAVQDRMIPSDPSASVRLPQVVRSEVQIPTPAEIGCLLDAVAPRYRALIAVGAGLGLRQGEAFGLSLDRVALTTVKIDRQLKRAASGVGLGALKTKRSYRTIPLPQSVAGVIAAHITAGFNLDPDGRPDPDGLLFLAPQGGRIRRDVWNRQALKPAVEAAGIEWLTYHSLRHFFASALIRGNHAAAIVAARMGNTPQMVHSTYSHLWPGDDDRTRQAIDAVLGPQRGTEKAQEGGAVMAERPRDITHLLALRRFREAHPDLDNEALAALFIAEGHDITGFVADEFDRLDRNENES